ncbi:MAG: hypothetical protein LBV58_02665 [Acholeplasmatales bacterium]|jgi:exo-poly-alpha-galacturonosidase|nr:hypothetical protein [Acholeplasmatales bacterium]
MKKIVLLVFVFVGVFLLGSPLKAVITDAPRNLNVPPAAFDDKEIILEWDKPIDYDLGLPIIDYQVFEGETLLGSSKENFYENYLYQSVYVDALEGASTENYHKTTYLSFRVTGLSPDTTYNFKVRAVYDIESFSAFSEVLEVRTAKLPVVIDATQYGVTYVTESDASFLTKYKVFGAADDPEIIESIRENTENLQNAIDNTPAGGKLVLKGSELGNSNPYYYVSGSLFLHSDMTLEIEEGAVLLGSPVFDHYPRSLLVYPYSQDIRTFGLLNAVTYDYGTVKNVRLVGKGIVDGNGWKYGGSGNGTATKQFQGTNSGDSRVQAIALDRELEDPIGLGWKLPVYRSGSNTSVYNTGTPANSYGISAADAMRKSRSDVTPNSAVAQWYNTRPNLVVFRGVENALFQDLVFTNAPFHGIVNYQGEGVSQIGTKVLTYDNNNGDGIEFGDTRNLHILNNFFDTGDDAINFAAGQGATVRNLNDRVATGEGRIANNYVRNSHGGLIAAGSHVAGWIGDLLAEENFYNCSESGNGCLRIKAGNTTGGGVKNIELRDSLIYYSVNAVFCNIETSYSDGNASTAFAPESEYKTTYANVKVHNLTIDGVSNNYLITVPNGGDAAESYRLDIKNFNFENIVILKRNTGANALAINLQHEVKNFSFSNITSPNDTRTITVNVAAKAINVTLKDVQTQVDRVFDGVEWENGDIITSSVTGQTVNLSWEPLNTENVRYDVLVQDERSVYYVSFKENLIEPNTEFVLPPLTHYNIKVVAHVTNTNITFESKVGLTTSVTTLASESIPNTIVVPANPLNGGSLSAPSGYAWKNVRWKKATESAPYKIYYYILTATDSKGTKHVFYDYNISSTTNEGYSLVNIPDGEQYTLEIEAVSSNGNSTLFEETLQFETVPATENKIPIWNNDARITANELNPVKGEVVLLTWNNSDCSHDFNPATSRFAGYRVFVDGIVIEALGTKITQVNATPTTTNSYFALDTSSLSYGSHTIKIEAGYEILKYQSGSTNASGSTSFLGTNNTELERNQITLGKWSGHGPSIEINVYEKEGVITPSISTNSIYLGEELPELTFESDIEGSISWDLDQEISLGINTYTYTFTPSSSSYKEIHGSYQIEVLEPVITSISATLSTSSYLIYPSSSLEDVKALISVTSTNSIGVVDDVLSFEIVGNLSLGTTIITVIYDNHLTTVEIIVSSPELRDITVEFDQGSKVITESSSLDVLIPLLVVTANYIDGTSRILLPGEYEISGELEAILSNIDISYNGASAEIVVTVETAPIKLITATFTQGDLVIYPGSSLEILKSKLIVKTIDSLDREVLVPSYVLEGNLSLGTTSIIVTYLGFTTKFTCNVIAPPIDRLEVSYSQDGDIIYDSYSVTTLIPKIVVTAYYVDGTSKVLSDKEYVLNGSFVEGKSTISVTVGNNTSSVVVEVTKTYSYVPERTTYIVLVSVLGVATLTLGWFGFIQKIVFKKKS